MMSFHSLDARVHLPKSTASAVAAHAARNPSLPSSSPLLVLRSHVVLRPLHALVR